MSPLTRLAVAACTFLSAASIAGADAVIVDSVLTTPTVYLAPTTYGVPTSYVPSPVYATSYATVYNLSPTAYYDLSPTSYLVPTYSETSYFVPSRYRFRPRYRATRYLDYAVAPTTYYAATPTTYYAPTTTFAPTAWDTSVVATSATVCGEPARVSTGLPTAGLAPSPAVSTAPPPTLRRSPAIPDRRSDPVVVSVPRDGAEPPLQDRPAPGARTDQPAAASPPEPDSPAATPAPAPAVTPAPAPASGDLPRIPAGDLGDPERPSPAGNPRIVQRPAFPASGILRGEVLSGLSRLPEEGVKVVVSSRTDPDKFKDRSGVTDAEGHFAIRVPVGDWTVKVATAVDKFAPVQNIIVSGGHITAENGAEFPKLMINR